MLCYYIVLSYIIYIILYYTILYWIFYIKFDIFNTCLFPIRLLCLHLKMFLFSCPLSCFLDWPLPHRWERKVRKPRVRRWTPWWEPVSWPTRCQDARSGWTDKCPPGNDGEIQCQMRRLVIFAVYRKNCPFIDIHRIGRGRPPIWSRNGYESKTNWAQSYRGFTHVHAAVSRGVVSRSCGTCVVLLAGVVCWACDWVAHTRRHTHRQRYRHPVIQTCTHYTYTYTYTHSHSHTHIYVTMHACMHIFRSVLTTIYDLTSTNFQMHRTGGTISLLPSHGYIKLSGHTLVRMFGQRRVLRISPWWKWMDRLDQIGTWIQFGIITCTNGHAPAICWCFCFFVH